MGSGRRHASRSKKETMGACRMWMWGRPHVCSRTAWVWQFEFGQPKGPIEAPGRPIDHSPSLPVYVSSERGPLRGLGHCGSFGNCCMCRMISSEPPRSSSIIGYVTGSDRAKRPQPLALLGQFDSIDRLIDQSNSIKAKSAALHPRFDSGGMSGTFSSG